MSIFTLARQAGSNIRAASGNRYLLSVVDEDGAVLFQQHFPDSLSALKAAQSMQTQLQELRTKYLGTPSLAKLKREYRAAKDLADLIRDQFIEARLQFHDGPYKNERGLIKP